MRGKYLVFGLVVDTPISLPEAYPAEPRASADVVINIGAVSDDFPKDELYYQSRRGRLWWQAMPEGGRVLFNCLSGLYDVRGGNSITIQLYPGADMEQAKIFLLGTAMGAIQAQRGRIPLHGGAVYTSRGALIVSGVQGSGKSTMASAFVCNGYEYLTDDVSSVSIKDGQAEIVPAYPQRKLARDACAPLGYDAGTLTLVDSKRDKLAVRDQENWRKCPAPLAFIIELHALDGGAGVTVNPIKGHEKLTCVMRNLYRAWMHLPGIKMDPRIFKKILSIAAQAEIYSVGVPRDINGIRQSAHEISCALGLSQGI